MIFDNQKNKKMKLSDNAINSLRISHKAKARLMYELNVGTSTVWRWISENAPDGELTRVRAVRILAEELNLPEEGVLMEVEELTIK